MRDETDLSPGVAEVLNSWLRAKPSRCTVKGISCRFIKAVPRAPGTRPMAIVECLAPGHLPKLGSVEAGSRVVVPLDWVREAQL